MARTFTSAAHMAAALEAAAHEIPGALAVSVRHEATLLRVLIQAMASGRPGPNVINDRYRPSWRVVSRRIPGGAAATVGTRAPQGRRLEFGFVGYDSLGRYYNQPPFPHVQPAMAVILPAFDRQILKTIEEVIR